MNTADQVAALVEQMKTEGVPKPDAIRQTAFACLEWPYVFGAWGEECTPSNRKRRERSDHPTIKSKCQVLSGRKSDCSGCKWHPADSRVRMFDCRGFTAWLLKQVELSIAGQGATSQWKTASNWVRQGPIDEMPDCVCCLFRAKGSTMEHTGMHVGGGVVVDCSVNVRTGGLSGWTHYAIPVGLYDEGEIPTSNIRPTIRKGTKGDLVRTLQDELNRLGYDCGKADGVFGTKTYNAVVQFQTAAGLDPDGVVGYKTWKALDEAEEKAEPDVLYRVVCPGMTWAQVQRIRDVCPTADVTKE